MSLSKNDEGDVDRENTFDLESGNYFTDEEEGNLFGVGFKAEIKDKEFDLVVEAIYDFEVIDGKITEEFKLSHFPKVNAPAIAFPYLRSFISILTMQAGFDPVMLPSINFTKAIKNGTDSESDTD